MSVIVVVAVRPLVAVGKLFRGDEGHCCTQRTQNCRRNLYSQPVRAQAHIARTIARPNILLIPNMPAVANVTKHIAVRHTRTQKHTQTRTRAHRHAHTQHTHTHTHTQHTHRHAHTH